MMRKTRLRPIVPFDEPQTIPNLAMTLADEAGGCQVGTDEREQLIIGKQSLWSSLAYRRRLGKPLLFSIKGGSGLFPGMADALDAIELAGSR